MTTDLSRTTSNQLFTTVRSEGGLLLPDLLTRIAANDRELSGLDPASFGLPAGERLTEATSRGWDQTRNHWAEFKAAIADRDASAAGVTETRGQWVIPLLRELGYDDLQFRQAAEVVDGRRYGISHRAGSGPLAPPVHIVSHQVALDTLQSVEESTGPRRISPHSLVQEFLNRTDHLWGIVTNGKTLRLLRDNQRLSRAAYLEFDLESMMEGSVYADYVLLYLVLHRTRLPMAAGAAQPDERPEDCLLEQWVTDQEAKGARALDDLRAGVEIAIEALGQGLLEHPANQELHSRLDDGTLSLPEYYRQLLRLIYRLLFLLAAEDRNLLFDQENDPLARTRYADHYSVGRLRQLVPRRRRYDRHDDLWRSLQITFRVLRDTDAAATLGIPPLGGGLFDERSCAAIEPFLISNERLLEAIRGLTYVEKDGRLQRTNYRDMDVEELGSVYEGLLEMQPSLTPATGPAGTSDFTLAHSGERKSTGSYYTNSGLVQELIRSALDPVIAAALQKGATAQEKRDRLLDLKVCDPACGSGHFLLAAARRIGRELARVERGDEEPDAASTRHGVRQAIQHCVYGVDFNPLAVDLCKVALWLEAHEPGKPIGFLDHHIRHGNSLVGATTAVMDEGIPTDAFKEVTGDDKATAAAVRKRNTQERKGQLSLQWQVTPVTAESLQTYFARMDQDDESVDAVEQKEKLFTSHRQTRDFWRKQIVADLWTAAFFWPLQVGEPQPPTHGYWRRLSTDKDLVDYILAPRKAELQHKAEFKTVRRARTLSRNNRFFHWELEFEDVFGRDDPGFDVILANPPWERVKLQEQEFFAARDRQIAEAPNAAARRKMITALTTSAEPHHRALYRDYRDALRRAEGESKFLRTSGRYPLTGRGDVNTYSVFAELMATSIGSSGRAGMIVPTGIATDDTNKHFFGWLVDEGRIAALFDFQNKEGLFPNVLSLIKFTLLTMFGKPTTARSFPTAFFVTQPHQLREEGRVFTLSAEEIALLNPNTRTCPIFRTSRDAEITKAIYRASPVLVREGPPEVNPWGITFKTLFHMSNDSHLFRTREQLTDYGYRLGEDGRFRGNDEVWLPLYEAKLIHQYDHRFATFEGSAKQDSARDTTLAEHQNPEFVVTPRYWVDQREVEKELENQSSKTEYLIGWRDFARNTDARSFIASVFPRTAAGDTLLIMRPNARNHSLPACLVSNLNSLTFDYATRQKLGGVHLKFFTVKQLPVLPPETYTPELLSEIVPRVLELVYTAHDMTPFARDLGFDGPPFPWNEERRAQLRADLDGIYAHLYGLDRDDFSYILDQFPIVERNDVKQFGEYRTKRLCLDAWDRWEGVVR